MTQQLINQDDFTATYSAEDNKLRLYASRRLTSEEFEEVKKAGYKWAPKQKLFVAPRWTPNREDLAIFFAGDIEPETITMAERAAMKAERLENIATNKQRQANAYTAAAREISDAIPLGQPILVGHHSERRHRKDAERIERATEKAAKALDAIGYYLEKAESVERHANYKNSDKVRANRIKTLLAELRDLQRRRNHAAACLATWERLTTPNLIRAAVGRSIKTGQLCDRDSYSDLTAERATPEDIRERNMKRSRKILESENLRRWIEHTLNRLGYERAMLGSVARYDGPITAATLQTFARTHGADSPKATQEDGEQWTLESGVPLPAHLTQGAERLALTLDADQWRDLMQSAGYEVPAKKPAKPPILNFRASAPLYRKSLYGRAPEPHKQIEMTKAQYNAIYSESRFVVPSACGEYRFRTAPDPDHKGARWCAPRVAVFLTDSKEHAAPVTADQVAAE